MNPADAYDRVAPTYDETLAADDAMRRRLWARYDAAFPPGSRVLDLGCGTGIDTIHLAEHGIEVVAVDVSEGMLDVLREKLVHRPELRVDVRRLAFDELASVEGPFDGVVSAFAALSTLAHLGDVARELRRLVRPGGTAVVHVLKRRRRDVVRSFVRGAGRAFRVGGADVVHYLRGVADFRWDGFGVVAHTNDGPFLLVTLLRMP